MLLFSLITHKVNHKEKTLKSTSFYYHVISQSITCMCNKLNVTTLLVVFQHSPSTKIKSMWRHIVLRSSNVILYNEIVYMYVYVGIHV
jgi:hypothetical protein